MKRQHMILMIAVPVIILVLIMMISYFVINTKAVEKRETISALKSRIYTSYQNRYDVALEYVTSIENANQQILDQISLVTDARSRFADAIAGNQYELADEIGEAVDNTFISLVSYMEDNPAAWNTMDMYNRFLIAFTSSTNAITHEINSYDMAVAKYNAYILAPYNKMFLIGYKKEQLFQSPNVDITPPTFG